MTRETPVLHRGVGEPTACRSCGRAIVFAVHGTTGKLHPFESDDAKGVWVIENGTARHVGTPEPQLELGASASDRAPRFTSHFATCPDAQQWRGRR